MKPTINIARVIVGLLFIFSGLVKANDPHGLEYKMYEFFETWGWHQNYSEVVGFSLKKIIPFVTGNFQVWMVKHALLMSVLMNAFEIIAGFALLLGWRIKLFSWLLLLLILFFTFLTGYTYITGKPTNCGCFGDCLPISSRTSFLKDVALTILIGFIFWKRKYVKPLFGEKVTTWSMLGITFLSFGFQWYTLSYLPVVDCLPYKKGKNINDQMKIPAGARPDSLAIVFVYEKEGKQFEFSPSGLPADLDTYKFVSRRDKLIRKGNAEAPIHGFVLSGVTDEDSTQIVLNQPYAILLFCEDFSIPVSKWEKGFAELYAAAKAKNIPAYMITTKPREAPDKIKNTSFTGIPVFKCDYTAIRTAARTNPCIYLLKEGTIIDKQSYKKINSILSTLKGLPATSN